MRFSGAMIGLLIAISPSVSQAASLDAFACHELKEKYDECLQTYGWRTQWKYFNQEGEVVDYYQYYGIKHPTLSSFCNSWLVTLRSSGCSQE